MSENPEKEGGVGEEILALVSSNKNNAVYAGGNSSKIYIYQIVKSGSLNFIATFEVLLHLR